MIKKQNVLLLEDIQNFGRSGDVILVKTGFARNFLVPRKMALVATKHTLLMQKELKVKRNQLAAKDKKDSEELAMLLEKIELIKQVKVDPEGHMYGSVSALNIVELLKEEGITIEKSNMQMKSSLKKVGSFKLELMLKENVKTFCMIKIMPEGAKELKEDSGKKSEKKENE